MSLQPVVHATDRTTPNRNAASLPAHQGGGKESSGALQMPPGAPRRLTGLRSEELCNPGAYVVESDFAPALHNLKGFLQRHQAELAQWHQQEGVTPTLGALLALLRFFQGLAPGRGFQKGDRRRLNGVGVQVPLRWLAAVLGRNKATVCEAKALGVELGLLECYSPIRRVANVTRNRPAHQQLHAVTTKDGVERSRVHVHGVIYLTPAGAAWLDRRGTTRAELRARNARQSGRGRVLTGILWEVLRTLSRVRRLVAARFSPGNTEATPDDRTPPIESNSVVAVPVGNAADPPKGAVRPLAADDWRPSARPGDAARATLGASAPPAMGSSTLKPRSGPQRLCDGDAGLSGGGALSPLPAKPRGVGYGPPLRPGLYLDAETERCWRRHVVAEGGPPRRVSIPLLAPSGFPTGDSKQVLMTGRVRVWSPAVVAAEAYPGEWSAAPAVVRAQLEADFRMYLGPRLRRRLLAREELRRGGAEIGCPVEGCQCQKR